MLEKFVSTKPGLMLVTRIGVSYKSILRPSDRAFTAAFVGQVVPALVRDSNVGQTDLLITWIYKITTNSSYDYGMASVLGLMIFVIIAFFSLIFYSNSSANKDEEAFQ